jgi:hypothetical protein
VWHHITYYVSLYQVLYCAISYVKENHYSDAIYNVLGVTVPVLRVTLFRSSTCTSTGMVITLYGTVWLEIYTNYMCSRITWSISDIMGTVLRYLFLPTELLWGAGTRPSSVHLQYCWYPSTLLYYPLLVSTTGTLQYLNYTCASLWRPSHGTFCTWIPLDYYQSLSHSSRWSFSLNSAREPCLWTTTIQPSP